MFPMFLYAAANGGLTRLPVLQALSTHTRIDDACLTSADR
jgi:hypothetical protein